MMLEFRLSLKMVCCIMVCILAFTQSEVSFERLEFNTSAPTFFEGLRICSADAPPYSTFQGVKGYLTPMDCATLHCFTQMAVEAWRLRAPEDQDAEVLIYAETGSYNGLSSHVVANAARLLDAKIAVYAHDIFDYAISRDTSSKWEVDVSEPLPRLQKFYSSIKRNNLRNTIIPIPGKSHETLALHDNDSLDLLFIDGDHTYEGARNDLEIGWRKLRRGAWVLGHDCIPDSTANNGVRKAVVEFSEKHGVQPMLIHNTHFIFAIQKL